MDDSMPLVIVITHFVNLIVLLLLIRSGLHILADHPFLYWTDDTRRDNYWLKFGKKEIPEGHVYQAHDEAEKIGHWALPGGEHHDFGNARNWHFVAAIIWLATGAVYWGYMFATGAWRRLIPTSWSVFPDAWHDLLNYLSFHRPPVEAFQPYDPLQQLTYAAVAFLLPVLMILTAAAMSPALMNRFPKYLLLFGNRRQAARSLHFIGMVLFSVFIIVHVIMVALVYFYRNVQIITFGHTGVNFAAALTLFMAGLLFVLVFHIVITYFTVNHRVRTRQMLVGILNPVIHTVFGWMTPRKTYKKEDISSFFRINGLPPDTEEFYNLRDNGFKDWRLKVEGLVENELSLSLDELKQMPKQEQITKHICIQGWSAIGEWGGVHMREILERAKPSSEAKYVVFHAYDLYPGGKPFYEALRLSDMNDKYTILAYEMNWKSLPLEHGAPLRLRVERKLGYKMVKYIRSIEFVKDYKHLYGGRGGYREDVILFDNEASI
ncbi:MAG TPA: molybdopterin-dependent oxidoreductase [Candidatus Saccharimonadales bacterium]|nr:molybdopterin-dependent oxidoreductase [Candidatus Saccharimonadales bacterium]